MQDTNLILGQNYTTRQRFFDLGRVSIIPESSILLDSIVWFMNRNLYLSLEVSVYTDSRENPKRSDLSHPRARSIAEYLIKKGISMDRLVYKGYGSVKLLVRDEEINKAKTKEEKEALHAKNRRVVFTVIKSAPLPH